MKDFWIWVPTKIVFGRNCLDELADSLKKWGGKDGKEPRVLLVTGGGSIRKMGLWDKVTKIMDDAGLKWFEYSGVSANPKVSHLRKGIEFARENKVNVVLAVGGGSVIDEAKGIAVGYSYDGDIWDLSTELNSKGAAVDTPVLPVLTVLTLAATGTEMATGCNWTNDTVTPAIKRGLHGPEVRPKVTFENPEYTYSVSEFQTAAGSADILSHIFESYFSNVTTAYMQARVAEALMKTVIKYAPIAMREPDNYEARANLMYCASWGNNGYIVKGNQVNWSVHALEHELTSYNDTTHGEGLAIITPRWMEWVIKDETKLYRFVDLGQNVFGLSKEGKSDLEFAKETIQAVKDFFWKDLKLKTRIRDLGIEHDKLAMFTEQVCKKLGYLAGCYKPLTKEAIEEIYEASY